MLADHVCIGCSQQYCPTSARQLYCASECRLKSRAVEKCCEFCGETFLDATESHRVRFCSGVCRGKYRKHDDVEKVCEECSCKFAVVFIKRSQQFCSVVCLNRQSGRNRTANKTVFVVCEDCGHGFVVTKSRHTKGNVKFCSRKCLDKNLVGKGNPFYGKHHTPSTKFSGGRCKWHSYTKFDGTTIKLQGTWELAFAKWADQQGITYTAHRGRIAYVDDRGDERSYYPDFWVEDWQEYIEIKNRYHMSLQERKFELIRASNPNMPLRILMREELKKLGVWEK